MINTTGGNPLALACFTSNFFSNFVEITNQREWREARRMLYHLLNKPERKGVYQQNHESVVWVAIEYSLRYLKERADLGADAKDVLLLMYACKGDSIPEAVLEVWYNYSLTGKNRFFSSIGQLSKTELLKSLPGRGALKIPTWSMRPLLKLYMDQNMSRKEEIGPLVNAVIPPQSFYEKVKASFGALIGGISVNQRPDQADIEEVANEKRKVAAVLCALYFDPAHSNEVVKDAATRARAELLNKRIDDRKLKAIEPIIWLLVQPVEVDGTWTEANVRCVRKVLVI